MSGTAKNALPGDGFLNMIRLIEHVLTLSPYQIPALRLGCDVAGPSAPSGLDAWLSGWERPTSETVVGGECALLTFPPLPPLPLNFQRSHLEPVSFVSQSSVIEETRLHLCNLGQILFKSTISLVISNQQCIPSLIGLAFKSIRGGEVSVASANTQKSCRT